MFTLREALQKQLSQGEYETSHFSFYFSFDCKKKKKSGMEFLL